MGTKPKLRVQNRDRPEIQAVAGIAAAMVSSIIHQTGPIITGLGVSGRVGAGIGAELASMKVISAISEAFFSRGN